MKYQKAFLDILFYLLLLIKNVIPEALMCSKCSSAQDKQGADCEMSPPSPVRCFSSAPVNYCMIAKEYNKYGDQITFVRDCTTRGSIGDSCMDTTVGETDDPTLPVKVCYYICKTDGCNSSHKHFAQTWSVVFSCIVAYLLFNRNNIIACS